MNAPLASLIRWRVLDCAKRSARLRHALRQAAKARPVLHDTTCRLAYAIEARRRYAWAWSHGAGNYAPMLWPCVWTIGPRGKLP